MVIHPYKQDPRSPTWVFDDPKHKLIAEPFVGQINPMLDRLLESKGISIEGHPFAFSLFFSSKPIPDYDLHLEWTEGDVTNAEELGNYYTCKKLGADGWLCPALFCYFSEAPKNIYVKADSAVRFGVD